MTSSDARPDSLTAQSRMPGTLDMKLEVVELPVSDVDRADFSISDQLQVVQFTPTGSQASIQFGIGISHANPGSIERTYVFQNQNLLQAGTVGRVPGPAPERRTYGSFASFSDPDADDYVLQAITQRLPGRG